VLLSPLPLQWETGGSGDMATCTVWMGSRPTATVPPEHLPVFRRVLAAG
jgi:hypothetical protein